MLSTSSARVAGRRGESRGGESSIAALVLAGAYQRAIRKPGG